jgi:predicted LPLAT superfamily acyltransferase
MIHAVLKSVAPDFELSIIPIGQSGSALAVRDWLAAGGLVGMLGDRFLEGEAAPPGAGGAGGAGIVHKPFLGHPAPWSTGPLRLAQLLRQPVFFMAGLYRGGQRYEVLMEPLCDFREVPRGAAEREAQLDAALSAYVARLESLVREVPYNWFNFHDFWHEDARAA